MGTGTGIGIVIESIVKDNYKCGREVRNDPVVCERTTRYFSWKDPGLEIWEEYYCDYCL